MFPSVKRKKAGNIIYPQCFFQFSRLEKYSLLEHRRMRKLSGMRKETKRTPLPPTSVQILYNILQALLVGEKTKELSCVHYNIIILFWKLSNITNSYDLHMKNTIIGSQTKFPLSLPFLAFSSLLLNSFSPSLFYSLFYINSSSMLSLISLSLFHSFLSIAFIFHYDMLNSPICYNSFSNHSSLHFFLFLLPVQFCFSLRFFILC